MQTTSRDGSTIHYDVTGRGDTALVFVHGWMGNVRWWDAARDAFAATHRVVALDLAGHGASSRTRTAWTGDAYAQDILAVVRAVAAPRVVLVGHSMSGAYASVAAPDIPELAALVLVDTMKDLGNLPAREQVAPILATYRADFPTAVATFLPKMLFSAGTPPAVVERLRAEFLSVSGDHAATLLAPLFDVDLRAAARGVRVPVHGIGTDLSPSDVAANRAYFADYDYASLDGYGHYPMLEAPELFHAALRRAIR